MMMGVESLNMELQEKNDEDVVYRNHNDARINDCMNN